MNAILYSGFSPSSIYILIYIISVISLEGKSSELPPAMPQEAMLQDPLLGNKL